MMGIPLKNIALSLLLLLAFGVARLPLERSIEEDLREQHYVDDAVGLSMMDQLGQGGFAAALGGYRPLVANIYYLIAHGQAFDQEEWGRVDQTFGLVTTLQPRSSFYKEQHIWQIGWNAYAWARGEADYQRRLGNDWKAATLEDFTAPGYIQRAEEIALKGAETAPDNYRFFQRVGDLYDQKLDDQLGAARWYQKGSEIDGAPGFMHRIFVVLLARSKQADDEAYPLLQERYWGDGPRDRSPSVRVLMEQVEDRLGARMLEEEGVEAVRRRAESDPDNYFYRATLAKHYAEMADEPRRAMEIYRAMVDSGGQVPEYYKMKWALLAAGFPEYEVAAYRTLREFLAESRRRLTPEEAAIIQPLEERVRDRLNLPEEALLFPGKSDPGTAGSE